MGRQHLVYIDQRHVIVCKKCGVHLTSEVHLVSRDFMGSTGVLTHRFNITKGNKHEKEMSTGLHIVSDVYCVGCEQYLGWGYDYAYTNTEKYKEDCFILEKAFFEEVRMENHTPEE